MYSIAASPRFDPGAHIFLASGSCGAVPAQTLGRWRWRLPAGPVEHDPANPRRYRHVPGASGNRPAGRHARRDAGGAGQVSALSQVERLGTGSRAGNIRAIGGEHASAARGWTAKAILFATSPISRNSLPTAPSMIGSCSLIRLMLSGLHAGTPLRLPGQPLPCPAPDRDPRRLCGPSARGRGDPGEAGAVRRFSLSDVPPRAAARDSAPAPAAAPKRMSTRLGA
jgi:hypothetical protein